MIHKNYDVIKYLFIFIFNGMNIFYAKFIFYRILIAIFSTDLAQIGYRSRRGWWFWQVRPINNDQRCRCKYPQRLSNAVHSKAPYSALALLTINLVFASAGFDLKYGLLCQFCQYPAAVLIWQQFIHLGVLYSFFLCSLSLIR